MLKDRQLLLILKDFQQIIGVKRTSKHCPVIKDRQKIGLKYRQKNAGVKRSVKSLKV